jgi:pimeloyl-ACP methyl ester carboxylesterase
MSRYVLVHGSWHAGWVWDRVAPILMDAGHEVEAPDLPGRAGDGRDPALIALDDHVDRIVALLGTPADATILVGHSFGGFVISHVAERVPGSIRLLVFVAAFLVPTGGTVLETATADPPSEPYLDVDEAAGLIRVRPDAARMAFYADCSPDDADRAVARLVPEALAPRRTPASLSDARFGSVRRAYIQTLDDRALPIEGQRRMHADLPCDEVVSLPSGHSPFLSMPGRLAETLLRLGAL